MKKILTILLLIMIGISLYEIITTYALYKTKISGEYKDSVGIWSIKINEKDLEEGITAYNYVKTFSNGTQHSADGTIAPGDTTYFDIEIDPTDTDVSILYSISIDITDEDLLELMNKEEDLNFINNIQISSVESFFVKNEERIENVDSIINNEHTINKGLIPLSRINNGYINKVRVYVKWNNDETNNIEDTLIGSTEDANFEIAVKLQFKQYLGEEWETWETT